MARFTRLPDGASDASDIEDVARAFATSYREFASPNIHYAEAVLGDARWLLARCPDSETANRLARKMREQARDPVAVPICGYATSGWANARRRIPVQ